VDDDKSTEWGSERSSNDEPLTIHTPKPSDRVGKVTAWLADPAIMLGDLTDTLNQVLSLSHERHDYWVDLIPGLFDSKNLLDVQIAWGFKECAEQVEIRNSLELTPFSPAVVRDVELYFLRCAWASRQKQNVAVETASGFTSAIQNYKLQLQILADWIEARAIFQGKKTLDPNRPKENRATEHDILQAIQMIVDSGRTVTKQNLGDTIRHSLNKTIATDRVQMAAHHFNRCKKNGPE